MRVLLAIVLFMACGGCKRQASPTVFVDPALAVLVPQDTKLLAGVRMQKLQKTAFYSDSVANAPRLLEFRKQLGLPADSDIWEYVIASGDAYAVVLLRGKFAEMGMEPRLAKPSVTRMSVDGVPVLGDDEGSVAFLNPTTAIAGRFDAVARAVQVRNENTGIPAPLASQLAQLSARNDLWFVSSNAAPGFLPTDQVAGARGGIDPHSRTFEIQVETRSEGAARAIAEMVKGHANGTRVVASGPIPNVLLDWVRGTASR